ncbi:MAG: EI24 domain-containing protein [Sphingomonadales bacterium]|nr:EI24 domain-containing protein [Sphingomonadales bacterium]MBD3774308.1 EI24 domain-containing protein [Paracoccaceae bacterium]
MTGVPSALLRAIGQLGDRAVLAIVAKSMAITLAIFAALALALWELLGWAAEHYAAGYGAAGAALGLVLGVVAAWLLFRFVALAVVQFFADEIVLAVERRHYPQAAASARTIPFREELANSLAALARAVLVNLVALPVGLVLLVTGVGTALWFWAVNAWLLGRELQDMAWLRHAHSPGAPPPMSGGTRFLLGGAIAALLLVPFANLLAPVIGAAAATHLVQRRKGVGNGA